MKCLFFIILNELKYNITQNLPKSSNFVASMSIYVFICIVSIYVITTTTRPQHFLDFTFELHVALEDVALAASIQQVAVHMVKDKTPGTKKRREKRRGGVDEEVAE